MSDPTSAPPDDARLHERIATSFERQGLMAHLGARLTHVSPGRVHLELTARPELSQQHGHVHGGAIATLADTAGGYAALTLLPDDREVLTTGFTIDFLAPAGRRLEAVASVLKHGRTLTVCRIDVLAHGDDSTRLIAAAQQTLISTTAPGSDAAQH
ncbi:thioesterase superfamily protein [Cellulomonas flavigena DSM 20109]|uniref:Thioesterase superfamily protein n=1 Tax=Cellulomonas flavigena (strain ATCC 482 / DSM 20109 / BCRC 11376 / JCM 18109 / NBRC 3775 / NCIMB 8073 / NRS 134) TaxID=446466 RepID=D5UHS2_CELFN|nr:PaaI family thioesterase [Cellulomonas flavigena]ADG73346.1 thioesterase superfamily protein [Cellulomonas flavigena DSM 20109]